MSRPFKIGNEYGMLVALKDLGRINGRRVALFGCACGAEKELLVGNVQRRATKSCGHLRAQMSLAKRLPPGEAQLRFAYGNTRAGAARRSLNFDLTLAQFREIVVKRCHYCDCEPSFRKQKSYASGFAMTGVDRRDNKVGYAVENCVSCCPTCNMAKGQMTVQEFEAWIERVHRRLSQ